MTAGYKAFDKELREKYKELNLKHLNEIKFFQTYLFEKPLEILSSKELFNGGFLAMKMLEEMDFISMDLKYVTAYLYLLRPAINNPKEENGSYFQTVEDRRYLMHTNFGLQAVYNFWDRLGDVLWHFFPTKLKEKDVFFDRVINGMPDEYKKTNSYLNLIKLYEKKVKPMLRERKEAVHYFQPEARHYWEHFLNSDQQKMTERFNEKYAYADRMQEQLLYMGEGLQLTIILIDELPKKK